MHHDTDVSGWVLFEAVAALTLVIAALGYSIGLWAARGRSRWPGRRTLFWYLGLGCVGAGLTGPIAEAAHTSFTAHMSAHLLVGMIGPVLLVLAAPVTLALRALPVERARVLSRVLSGPGVRVLTHPVTAGVLNAGGLWLLYTTGLYELMHASVLVHALVHTHILVAGYLFTASLIGVDPNRHRASIVVRSAVLVVFIAAHSILAKWLYVHPPAGVQAADAEIGAQLMYYGGDVVDIALIILLLAGWHRSTRPRQSPMAGARTVT